MKGIHSIVLVFVCLLSLAFATPANNKIDFSQHTIQWHEDDKLTWNDFTGSYRLKGRISALTASAIEYSYECINNQLDVKVKAIFIPEESWMKPDAVNDYILNHEQLHFDITEIYARKMRKIIQEEIKTCDDLYKVEAISEYIIKHWKEEQSAYDAHTNHSLNENQQLVWNEKIAKNLRKTAAYAIDTTELDN